MTFNREQNRRLQAYLGEHAPDLGTLQKVTQLKGGQSNPTYCLTTNQGRLVLRQRPAGASKWTHDIQREFTVLSALHDTDVPTPEPYVYCSNEQVIGGEFYLMEFVDGRIVDDCRMPGFSPDERFEVYRSFTGTIAKLHAVEPANVGLAEFGRADSFLERQHRLHTRLYQQYEPEGNPHMEWLAEVLECQRPEQPGAPGTGHPGTSIIHNDIRLGNVVIHPVEPRVIAILDWEMSSLGHTLSDAAFMLLPYYLPAGNPQGSFVDFDHAAAGIPTEQQIIDWYCSALGIEAFDHVSYMITFALYRYASVYAGIASRFRQGISVSADAHRYEAAVEPTALAARRLAESTFAA